jgi:hypothetical protein
VAIPETAATTSSATSSALTTAGSLAGRGDGPVIYVTSQGLFYDSIITADPVPPKGPFQLLEMGGRSGLKTEFGPGDPGYVGGRWVETFMTGQPHYFVCPLLGPGRTEP